MHQGKIYDCHYCNESFKSDFILKGHIDFTHEGKKVGNVNNVKHISKQKARWNNILKPFIVEREIIFVSYAAKHLYANLT